jgi:hypothetical protein
MSVLADPRNPVGKKPGFLHLDAGEGIVKSQPTNLVFQAATHPLQKRTHLFLWPPPFQGGRGGDPSTSAANLRTIEPLHPLHPQKMHHSPNVTGDDAFTVGADGAAIKTTVTLKGHYLLTRC